MSSKPSLPKGTRDFNPEVMHRRNTILAAIKSVFVKYGYQPLETPAMENLSVLTGKYGEEGDRLLYRILNSGDFLSKSSEEDRNDSKTLSPKISEKGLRYDLTVPFARFVAMNRHELAFPFKRYQVQPVWRADRPQKGRYREFYQCDADVVGTKSLICEAEIILMINEVFEKLGVSNYKIKFNNRKLLDGLCDTIESPGKLGDLSVAIDKIDKIGWEGVKKELTERGFNEGQVEEINEILHISGPNEEKIEALSSRLIGAHSSEGISETQEVLELLQSMKEGPTNVEFDLSLARGLSYYTGSIFEVIIENSGVGSVAGGGRYDNLTGAFGVEGIPGIGFSFGIDRLYDALTALDLFAEDVMDSTKALVAHFDTESMQYGLKVTSELRAHGIASEIYPDVSKIKKQLGYADRKHIPYVIIIGSNEMASGNLKLKNMRTGKEEELTSSEIAKKLNA